MLAARVEQRMKSRARQKWRDVTLDKESPIQAVCGKAARTVLCGGRDENRVSTATASRVHHACQRRGGCLAARGARSQLKGALLQRMAGTYNGSPNNGTEPST